MKKGIKRRRTKEEIEEAKKEEMAKQDLIQEKMAGYGKIERELAKTKKDLKEN